MKKVVLILSLATLVCGSAARAQTLSREDSLKATHNLLIQAVKAANVTMLASIVHPQALGFFRDSQRLVELNPQVTVSVVVTPILADLSLFTLTQYDTVFRLSGDVGVVSLVTRADSTKKNDRYLRSTYVYVRSGDAWKLLTWHTSDTPLKR